MILFSQIEKIYENHHHRFSSKDLIYSRSYGQALHSYKRRYPMRISPFISCVTVTTASPDYPMRLHIVITYEKFYIVLILPALITK